MWTVCRTRDFMTCFSSWLPITVDFLHVSQTSQNLQYNYVRVRGITNVKYKHRVYLGRLQFVRERGESCTGLGHLTHHLLFDVKKVIVLYLGSVVADEGSKPEIISRIEQMTAALTRLKPVWDDRNISLCSNSALM